MGSKARALQLIVLAYGTGHGGVTFSIIGPSLPDLQCLFNVELEEIASLFLVLGLAVAGSCLISTFLIRVINMYTLMASVMLMNSIGIGVIALTRFMYVAWVGLFASGFANGLYFVCSMVLCSIFHDGDAYALHVIPTALSLGNFLGPLIVKPFLGTADSNVSSDNLSLLIIHNSSLENLTKGDSCILTASNVDVLYIIIGVFSLPVSFGFCLLHLIEKPNIEDVNVTNQIICQIDIKGISATKTAYMMVVYLSFPMTYGLAFAYGSYLTTIGVTGSHQLGIQKSALMTSIFWLMFLFGRVTSTVLSNYITQQTIMYISLTGQIISSGVLCMYEIWGENALWIGSLVLAYMSGPNFACLVAWSRDYITLSPTILSMYGLMDFVGTSFLPYISGVLISLYGINAHLYFIFALCMLELILFLTAHCLGTQLLNHDADNDMANIKIGNDYGSLSENVQHETN